MATRAERRERLQPFLGKGERFLEPRDPGYRAQSMRLARAYKKWVAAEAKTAAVEVNSQPAEGGWPEDPALALAQWSRERLIVPVGHPLAGQPLELPPYITSFVRDALTHRESFLCLARKSAKSAGVAAFLLGRLVGPPAIRMEGYRGGVCSVTRAKAGELADQMEQIAVASGLEDLQFRRSPLRVQGPSGRVDILSADRTAGHASGFDDAIFDELGLLTERHRALVNGLRSSVSARNGRFIALSVQGAAPFTAELIARKDEPTTAVHHYAAPDGCELDDESAWHAASPALALGIKSLQYMRDESRRVSRSPSDQADFRLFDLNQPVAGGAVSVVLAGEYRACMADTLPPRQGRCWIGIDLGGNRSQTGLALYWIDSGRLEVLAFWPGSPTLRERGEADGVGDRYLRLADRGDLVTIGSTGYVSAAQLVEQIDGLLDGATVAGLVADSYRQDELQDAIGARDWGERIYRKSWQTQIMSADIEAFQQATLDRAYRTTSHALLYAIQDARLVVSSQGSTVEKAWETARIDPLSAALAAIGGAYYERRKRKPNYSADDVFFF